MDGVGPHLMGWLCAAFSHGGVLGLSQLRESFLRVGWAVAAPPRWPSVQSSPICLCGTPPGGHSHSEPKWAMSLGPPCLTRGCQQTCPVPVTVALQACAPQGWGTGCSGGRVAQADMLEH